VFAQAARLPADSADERVRKVRASMRRLGCAMDVCYVATMCAHACSSSTPQLLGCAHLGCLKLPAGAGGLAACEASLGVNRKGSLCGGCGVVRYCSAACAKQDWPGHRRVCRRLAAAAQRKDNVTVG